MDDDSVINIGKWIKDDGTLQGLVRQLEDVIAIIKELNNVVKNDDLTKWLNRVKQGSGEYKIAMSAATSLAEKLIAAMDRLVVLESEEGKELARLSRVIKDKTRDRQKEAEINSKVAGSYARMKLELQQLVEQYKNTTDASKKSKLADGIILLSNELMLADKELKNLMNDYTKLSATEQARLATLERERAESEAAAESIKKRAKAEAELNEVTKNRGAVESTALAEQMKKAIDERINLEAKELMLQDQFYAKELSSAEMIKQRLAIKEQLTQTEAKLKALEMQEANDLAIVKARVTMKQQQLDVEAKIVAAESQEGRNLAENEAKLKRIQQQNERNAQIATAVAGSYEHMKLTLQAKLDVLNNVNRSQGEAFSNALAEVAAAQKQVTEAEAWLNIVKQQSNEQVKLNLLSDQEYQSMVQKNKEIELEIKYTQGVVDSRAKLAAIQKAATTYNANGQSQLEEIKYNEELAASIKRVADLRAKAAAVTTQEYKDQLQAQNDLKKARLQAVADINVESATAKELASGTYAQIEARYNLLVMQIEELDNSTDDYSQTLQKLRDKIDEVASALETYDKAAGKSSNIMTIRQRQWDGLTNSVYQLTRELPNLAVRVDTFFLAISNNIPIFIEEVKRARQTAKSFGDVMAKVGKATLWGLALSIPLTILSRWSDVRKVFDSMFNTLSDGTLKLGAFNRALKDSLDSESSSFAKNIQQVRTLSKLWKESSAEQRSEFLRRYKKEIDETGLAIRDLNDAEKAFGVNTDLVVEGYIARTKAAAAAKLATDKYVEAIKKTIEAERVATKIAGKELTSKDLRGAFASKYGITDDTQIRTGEFMVSKSALGEIIEQYRKEIDRITPVSLFGDFNANVRRMNKELVKLEKEYESMADSGVANVPKEVAEFLALSDKGVFASKKLAKSLFEARDAFAQGDQATKKSSEELDMYSMMLEKAGVKLSDLTKKLDEYSLKVQKVANESKLMLLNNKWYRSGSNGDYGFDIPTFLSDPMGNIMEGIARMDVKSSFDRQIVEIRQARQVTLQEYTGLLKDLELLKVAVPKSLKLLVDGKITEIKTAMSNQIKAMDGDIDQVEREEAANYARVYADNVAMRLEAIKEGSDEELELRIRSIRASMSAEIAENATLEPVKQKSVSAIRAKYRREEEQAEREWLIKRNNWRKQQLENENAAELSITLDYYSRKRQIQQIELENELLENAELIENGQIKQDDIIGKHLKAQEKLWREHRSAVLSSQKSMWDVIDELSITDSYEQLASKLNKYDIELEQTKIQQREIIDLKIPSELKRISDETDRLNSILASGENLSEENTRLIDEQLDGLRKEASAYVALGKEVEDYLVLLDRLNEKRKNREVVEMGLRNYEKVLEAEKLNWETGTFQAGERQSELVSLEFQKRSLQYQIDNWEALGKSVEEVRLLHAELAKVNKEQEEMAGWLGTVSAVADHGLLGLVQIPDRNAKGERTGEWKDLSSDQYEAVETAIDSVTGSVNTLMQAYVDLAQAAYDAAQAQVDSAKTAYEAELEARANGYANDVEGAKKELQLEKNKAKQKEQILRNAQKAQERINTLSQISDLITASASILKAFALTPTIASALLATMWGMFAVAKIKASQAASQSSVYGEGGFELAVGGSHASGNDIKTGIRTRSGSQMVIEGGEGVGVFSRRAVSKYGDAIPNIVDSINNGSYGRLDDVYPSCIIGEYGLGGYGAVENADLASVIAAMQLNRGGVDLTAIEGLLGMILKGQGSNSVVLKDGSIMERKGNKTTITRRG